MERVPRVWVMPAEAALALSEAMVELPPTVVSPAALQDDFHVSLMERLHERWGQTISRRLTTQYRMHEQIMRFSSDEFYESSLIAADSVRSAELFSA